MLKELQVFCPHNSKPFYILMRKSNRHRMKIQKSSYKWNYNILCLCTILKLNNFPVHEKRQGRVPLAFFLFVHHFFESMCRHAGSALYLHIAGNRGRATPGQTRNRRKTSVLLIEFVELLDFLWRYSFGHLTFSSSQPCE